jgi:L1 cell adhesion molecule like protein
MAEEKKLVLGLSLGSHTGSMALYYADKDTMEVVADELGSRTIPCAVAYRGDEVIVGQAALSQQHKNSSNTFDDVRAMILNPDIETIYVPALEKDVSVVEIVSHYFRNIHNQIKQQVGKAVRECVLAVPQIDNDSIKQRLIESAQAGGIRIKCMVDDVSSALLAYGLDDPLLPPSRVVVVDMGWSRTEVSVFDINGGLFFPLGSASTKEVSGKVFVNCLAGHCAKDFQRKAKFSCEDNSKSMIRLRRECEVAIKSLSLGTEAAVDIDSLCEGVDYSGKISRARFDDLASIPFVQLKKVIADALSAAKVEIESVNQICMSGGSSAIPRSLNTMKAIFPTATFPKLRVETAEAQCFGAVSHAKVLMSQQLIDNAPTNSPAAPCLTVPISLASSDASPPVVVIASGTALPTKFVTDVALSGESGYVKVLGGSDLLAELVFSADSAAGPLKLSLVVERSGEALIEILQNNQRISHLEIQ